MVLASPSKSEAHGRPSDFKVCCLFTVYESTSYKKLPDIASPVLLFLVLHQFLH